MWQKKNNSVLGVELTRDIVIGATHTNVITISAPHRHDLSNESCVNEEVKIFNNKLHRKLERFRKVKLIEVPNERELYTEYGQHLNLRGKETIANAIAISIDKVLENNSQRHTELIPVTNKMDNQEYMESTHEKSSSDVTVAIDESDCQKNKNPVDKDVIQDTTSRVCSETNRSSNRTKKFPTSRYSDFLWEV